jgi:putative flippase GtrA
MVETLFNLLARYKIYVKYIIAGGTAAATDLILLFFFHDFIKMNVVVSATLAFVIAFFVSFYLQKFWTFRDNSRDKMKQQMGTYFMVGATNTSINAIAMYVLVDKIHIWYMLAQVLVSGGIAFYSFVIYKLFIFKQAV